MLLPFFLYFLLTIMVLRGLRLAATSHYSVKKNKQEKALSMRKGALLEMEMSVGVIFVGASHR